MKRLGIIFLFIISALLSVLKVNAVEIDATSYVLFEAKTGVVLEEKNSNQALYPASTTKIMTAILAIEDGNLDKVCVASQRAVYDIGRGGMNIGIMAGEEVRMIDLINALLVKSANETANIIAENIAPTRARFVEMMNERARELGATKTTFKNPCGIDTDKAYIGHNTSASDLAIITRHAMSLPLFKEIVQKRSYTMPVTNKHKEEVTLYTTNRMMTRSKYNTSKYYDRITGIKTGFTTKAGYTLVSSAINNDGLELVSVILGVKTGTSDRIRELSKELLEYGYKNYQVVNLAERFESVSKKYVGNSKEGSFAEIITDGQLSFIKPLDVNRPWVIEKKEKIYSPIAAPLLEGQKMGVVEYSFKGRVIGSVDLINSKNIEQIFIPEESTFYKVFKGLIVTLLIVVLLIFTLRLIVMVLNRRRMSYLMPKSMNDAVPDVWAENTRIRDNSTHDEYSMN